MGCKQNQLASAKQKFDKMGESRKACPFPNIFNNFCLLNQSQRSILVLYLHTNSKTGKKLNSLGLAALAYLGLSQKLLISNSYKILVNN